nr:MAG TPA: hypothetical protein [Bacteriophage sp.]
MRINSLFLGFANNLLLIIVTPDSSSASDSDACLNAVLLVVLNNDISSSKYSPIKNVSNESVPTSISDRQAFKVCIEPFTFATKISLECSS